MTRPLSPLPSALAVVSIAALLAGCAGGAADAQTDDADFSGLDLQASQTTGIIRGVVVDDAIRPVAGVVVNLQTEAGGQTATTNDDGLFGFQSLPGGTYFMTASKPGYTTSQSSTEVVAGVAEPPILKIRLVLDPATTPYVVTFQWNGFIECSMRVGVPTTTGVGLNACNDVGNQDVNFPVDLADLPDHLQGELIWQSTQTLGSGLSFVVGPKSCADVKWDRADGGSPLVMSLNLTELEEHEEFFEDEGLCYRVFSWTADEAANGAGLVTSQQFDAYFHAFYNFLPPEGWQFSVDGPANPPS